MSWLDEGELKTIVEGLPIGAKAKFLVAVSNMRNGALILREGPVGQCTYRRFGTFDEASLQEAITSSTWPCLYCRTPVDYWKNWHGRCPETVLVVGLGLSYSKRVP